MAGMFIFLLFVTIVIAFCFMVVRIGIFFQKKDYQKNKKKNESYKDYCERVYIRYF